MVRKCRPQRVGIVKQTRGIDKEPQGSKTGLETNMGNGPRIKQAICNSWRQVIVTCFFALAPICPFEAPKTAENSTPPKWYEIVGRSGSELQTKTVRNCKRKWSDIVSDFGSELPRARARARRKTTNMVRLCRPQRVGIANENGTKLQTKTVRNCTRFRVGIASRARARVHDV